MWAKIDEFHMSADPLKIIWDSRINSIVSKIALYQGALYPGCSVSTKKHHFKVYDKFSTHKFHKSKFPKPVKQRVLPLQYASYM